MKCGRCWAEVNPRWIECVACGWPVGEPKVFEIDLDQVVSWLNNFWEANHITLEEIPVEQRQRASALEKLMTEAANAGDLQRAGDALQGWRQCWAPGRCYKGGRPKWTIEIGGEHENQ